MEPAPSSSLVRRSAIARSWRLPVSTGGIESATRAPTSTRLPASTRAHSLPSGRRNVPTASSRRAVASRALPSSGSREPSERCSDRQRRALTASRSGLRRPCGWSCPRREREHRLDRRLELRGGAHLEEEGRPRSRRSRRTRQETSCQRLSLRAGAAPERIVGELGPAVPLGTDLDRVRLPAALDEPAALGPVEGPGDVEVAVVGTPFSQIA